MGLLLKKFRASYLRPSVEGFIVFTLFFLLAGAGKRSFTEMIFYGPALALAVDIVLFGMGFIAMEFLLPRHLTRLLRHKSLQPFRDKGFTVEDSKLVGVYEGYFGFITCSPRDKIGHRVITITFCFRDPVRISDALKHDLYMQSQIVWGVNQVSSNLVVKGDEFPPPEHFLSIAEKMVHAMKASC